MPEADLEIGPTLVRQLLDEQFPDLAGEELHAVTGGWDNAVVRLGTRLAVRLPRRQVAVPLAEHEHQWLPILAPSITIPIPVPLRVGKPSALFDRPWSVVPWVDGESVTAVPAEARSGMAAGLARFIGELHTPAPPDAPRNPVRGVPLADRDAAVTERLDAGVAPDAAALRVIWAEVRDTPRWSLPPRWIHGDLHPGNLLMRSGALAGVVDFGDLACGDPATDLAVGWLAFDREARRSFWAGLPSRYRNDADLERRALGWAIVLATAFLAHSDDNPVMAAIGHHAVNEVLADGPPAAR